MDNTIQKININSISMNPNNIRKKYKEEDLLALTNSIKQTGILVPLILKPDKNKPGKYIILAGHRRFIAAKKAGVTEIPYIISLNETINDTETMLIENIFREELPTMEVAQALKTLYDEYGSYNRISRNTGLSPSFIRSRIYFVEELGADVQEKLSNGSIKPNQIIEARPIKSSKPQLFDLIVKNCENNVLNNAMKIRALVKHIKENEAKIDDSIATALIDTKISEVESEYLLSIDDIDIRNSVLSKIIDEDYSLQEAISFGNSLIYKKNISEHPISPPTKVNNTNEYVTYTILKICDKLSELNNTLNLDKLDIEIKTNLNKYLKLITSDIDKFTILLENNINDTTFNRKNLFKLIIGGKN